MSSINKYLAFDGSSKDQGDWCNEKHKKCKCGNSCKCNKNNQPIIIPCNPVNRNIPFLHAAAAFDLPYNTDTQTITFGNGPITGSLSSSFNSGAGVFQVPTSGIYTITIFATFQLIREDAAVRIDGERYMRVIRSFSTGDPTERAFLAQYHYVPSDLIPPAPLPVRPDYSTTLEIGAVLDLVAGDRLSFLLYQNNSEGIPIPVFVELIITQLPGTPGVGTVSTSALAVLTVGPQ